MSCVLRVNTAPAVALDVLIAAQANIEICPQPVSLVMLESGPVQPVSTQRANASRVHQAKVIPAQAQNRLTCVLRVLRVNTVPVLTPHALIAVQANMDPLAAHVRRCVSTCT